MRSARLVKKLLDDATRHFPGRAARCRKASGMDGSSMALGNWKSTKPGPGFTVTEVVRLQLKALQENDSSDNGVAKAFEFASPGNQRSTGPLPKFAAMIKGGYSALLNSEDFQVLSAVPLNASTQAVRVSIKTGPEFQGGRGLQYFMWVLSNDSGGWRTDSVMHDDGQ
ncbi:unnamed protein product [Polarella glacialis]|uniref:Uncharacterized protein n=1 Tax=Polarella glacialis TaxID=89957 RepID=A0A813KD27_POLGL|nr:unnamed protein product [Polarella glacialis]